MKKAFAVVLITVLVGALSLIAQEQTQQKAAGKPGVLSPRDSATFSFDDGKKITVDYGRPSARGRKVMGALVPYGKLWRTGANEATAFTTDANLVIGGSNVPPGKYTLYTIPGEQEWTIIINRQTGQWGTTYDSSQDAVRIKAKPTRVDQPVEQFTIAFDKSGPNGGVMKLAWENTSVNVDFSKAQ